FTVAPKGWATPFSTVNNGVASLLAGSVIGIALISNLYLSPPKSKDVPWAATNQNCLDYILLLAGRWASEKAGGP
ncbi:MAG: hypothetical protein ABTR07_04095, partial [Candidatus Competibacter denitrificans]